MIFKTCFFRYLKHTYKHDFFFFFFNSVSRGKLNTTFVWKVTKVRYVILLRTTYFIQSVFSSFFLKERMVLYRSLSLLLQCNFHVGDLSASSTYYNLLLQTIDEMILLDTVQQHRYGKFFSLLILIPLTVNGIRCYTHSYARAVLYHLYSMNIVHCPNVKVQHTRVRDLIKVSVAN